MSLFGPKLDDQQNQPQAAPIPAVEPFAQTPSQTYVPPQPSVPFQNSKPLTQQPIPQPESVTGYQQPYSEQQRTIQQPVPVFSTPPVEEPQPVQTYVQPRQQYVPVPEPVSYPQPQNLASQRPVYREQQQIYTANPPTYKESLQQQRPVPQPGKGGGFFGSLLAPKSADELAKRRQQLESLQNEQNISKKVVDLEQTYKEGLTTLRDLLAPASLKFESSHFELNGKFGRSFFVLAYPRFLSSNWLSFIIQAEGALDVSMFIYPIDSETILKKLKSKVGEIGSQMAINQEKGMVRDPMLETAYQDVEGLRDSLMQGTEKYFRYALYFTLYANDLKELDKNSATLESALGAKLIVTKRALMQTQDGYNSTLPLGLDELDVANNMNTSPLSTTFPFVSSDLTGNDGILYGINRHNNSLILFDRFQMENANSVVFAKSGAGKSYAVKLEILRSLQMVTEVIVTDPDNEYYHFAEAVGGTYLNVSLNSPSRINPFDLPVAIEGEDNADVLRSAVVNLLGLFSLMLGKLNPTEEALMDKALWATYAKKDISAQSDFRTIEAPTMNDLIEILSSIVGAESLAQRLTKYTEGTFAGLFNQPTNVVLNNQLVVFSIRDLEDELRPIAMYIVLNYIWNVVRSELKKRILCVDEAWIMMQHEDSARFLFGMAKRGRKYYLGMTTITQDVVDFMASPYGKPIVTNSSMQLLLKQSPAAINVIGETFFLTEGEKYLLLESEVGEGIFFAGLKHAAIKIYASYVEDQIITTDPKQLLEIEESQQSAN